MENHMPKQQNWTPESPIEVYAATYESLAKALGGLQNKLEIPEAAREFVKRSAAAGRNRSAGVHAGANKVTGAIEEALVGAVNGLAAVNRKIADAVYQDAQAAFTTIDKLAGSKSLTEAYDVYVGYLRDQTNAGVGRVEGAVNVVGAKAAESLDAVRNGLVKVVPVRSHAA
jgi:hypothetical protein